jgi:UDP-glucuronate 4-epimerase
MKYLVTGAAGFIGAHLTSQLAASGNDLIAVDNYSDYYSVDLKRARVRNLLHNHGVNILQLDLREREAVRELFGNEQYDCVIHLAAQPGVRLEKSEYEKYTSNNLVAFENILSETVAKNVPCFLYASSSSVYGNSKSIPYSESESGIKPVSYYGATKFANEILTAPIVRNSATRARGLRFFTVYGPWGRPDMAYLRIIANALVNSPFQIFGDGNVIRDFTYIDDVVNATIELANELKSNPEGFSDVVNVGGGNPVSLNAMISEIGNLLGVTKNFAHERFHDNDVHGTHADTSYLKSLVAGYPETLLREGLSKVIEWAKTSSVINNLEPWIQSVE